MAGAKNLQDNLLLSLGSPGKFQVILFILLCSNAYPITFNFIFITFFGNSPPHNCKIPEGAEISNYIPLDPKVTDERDEENKYEKCKIRVDPFNKTSAVKSCGDDGYTYERNGYDWTIASEWNLVCDRHYLTTLAATIFFAGVMIGGLIFGQIADKFGRRPVVLFTLYGQAILGLGIAYSPNYVTFVILKFIQGSLLQGLQSSNNSLVMELFPLRYRTIAGMILAMCATSGHMALAGLLYAIPYWNYMQLTISLLSVVTIFYSWLYPESLRWLLSQNRQEQALANVQRCAKVNKIKLAPDIVDQLQEVSNDIAAKSKNVTKYDIRDLFRTKAIRIYTLVLLFCWFSASVTYYGIQFYIPKMKGKQYRYLNLFISGAMETAARVIGYFIIDRLGRRNPLIVFFALSGILCIATGLVGDLLKLSLVSNILAILGKLCSAQCFAFIGVFSSEIFPTVTRTIGLGAVACFARIGAMLAPQILDLKNYVSLWLPFVIFGSVSLISAGLISFLPETLGKPLPNTIEDVDEFRKPSIFGGAKKTLPITAPSSDGSVERGLDNPVLVAPVAAKNKSDGIDEPTGVVSNGNAESEKL